MSIQIPVSPADMQCSHWLNSIMLGQLREGCVAVPDKFCGDPVVAKSFNRSLAASEHIEFLVVSVPVPFQQLLLI
jgi:hypothetical protein